ncbi:hypothetical protein [Ideonella sp.]|uniref:hypothetical protein n=1 Tax=Ideonella sp. TaxID=1929293 RepID=UPI0035AF5E33
MTDDDKASQLKALAREIREELGEQNVLDALARELAAQRVAVAQLQEQLAALQTQLQTVVLVQKSRDILLPQARMDYAGRRQLTVEAGMPMAPDHGFHGLERDGVGNAFRWTGPTQAFHFDAHLDRTVPLRFVMQLPLWGAEHAQGLRASSDEQTLPLLQRQGHRVLEFEGMLFPRETLGLTRLSFIAPRLSAAPVDAEETATRQLGVPFLRLTVSEATADEVDAWRRAMEHGRDPSGPAARPRSEPSAGGEAATVS